eukprot:m.957621 g.957621  ORF g.957621 m.957621 type:complete len:850 (-) comp23876_c0_seq38:2828-5377(-)
MDDDEYDDDGIRSRRSRRDSSRLDDDDRDYRRKRRSSTDDSDSDDDGAGRRDFRENLRKSSSTAASTTNTSSQRNDSNFNRQPHSTNNNRYGNVRGSNHNNGGYRNTKGGNLDYHAGGNHHSGIPVMSSSRPGGGNEYNVGKNDYGGNHGGYRPGRRYDPSGARMGGGHMMHGLPPPNPAQYAPAMGAPFHGPPGGPYLGGRGGGGGPAVAGLLPVPPPHAVHPPPPAARRPPQGTYSAGGLLVLGPTGGQAAEQGDSPPNADDEYDPERPAMDNVSSHALSSGGYGGPPPMRHGPQHALPPPPLMAPSAQLAPPPLHSSHGAHRDNSSATGRSGGRGRGGGASGGKRPQSNVLDLNFIPEKDNTVAKLYKFYGKHGNIRHIRVGELSNGVKDPQAASIEFHYKENAVAAISDPIAVLNNRFIRVFFGRAERKATEAEVDKFAAILGALEVAAQAEKNMSEKARAPATSGVDSQAEDDALKEMVALQKKQQAMVDEQLGQQKKLLAKLASVTGAKERKAIMKTLTMLSKSIETLTDAAKKTLQVVQRQRRTSSSGADGMRGRGRGRGRRGRGRGRILHTRNTLDNRTTTLKITGFSEQDGQLKPLFQTFGPIKVFTVRDDGSAAFATYDSRGDAEEAHTRGVHAGDAALSLAWHEEDATAAVVADTNKPVDALATASDVPPSNSEGDAIATPMDCTEGAATTPAKPTEDAPSKGGSAREPSPSPADGSLAEQPAGAAVDRAVLGMEATLQRRPVVPRTDTRIYCDEAMSISGVIPPCVSDSRILTPFGCPTRAGSPMWAVNFHCPRGHTNLITLIVQHSAGTQCCHNSCDFRTPHDHAWVDQNMRVSRH